MQVTPYIHFAGCCEEAIAFYKEKLGARVLMLSRFGDIPEPRPEGMILPGFENKIMHAHLQIGDSSVMFSDGCQDSKAVFSNFALAITVKTPAEGAAFFNALSDGGQIKMPMTATYFSPGFGMLTDRFGVDWMIYTE